MRHYVLLLIMLAVTAMQWVNAQVKGHSYYALDGTIGGTDVEILLEVENEGRLALGQIQYQNGAEPIRLYGHRHRLDPSQFHFEEHLANGQFTGTINLNIVDGAIQHGEWCSVTDDTVYPLQVRRTKSFPYSQHRTFFRPATGNALPGHYISYIRQGKSIIQDRALNIMTWSDRNGFFSLEMSGETLVYGYYTPIGNDEFMHTGYDSEHNATYGVKVYEDFAEVNVIMPGENPDQDLKAEAFYIREEGVQEHTTYGIDGLYFVRARLDNGVPSLIVSRKLLEAARLGEFAEAIHPDLKAGRHAIRNVQGRVIDMYVQNIGYDIGENILCLLLEDHTVQVLSMSRFVQTGIDDLSDPLPLIEDIQQFYNYDPHAAPRTEESDYVEGEDGGDAVWGIDSRGASHRITLFGNPGDWITNPGEDVSGDGYLGMGQTWDIHIIQHEGKNRVTSYFGQFWIVEPDNESDNTTTVIGYRMTQMRNERDGIGEMVPCNVEGKFQFTHDEEDWQNIIVTPTEGLMFTPRGKTATYEFQTELG